MYDSNNVFAKIIRGEIPSKKVYEDDKVLAFYDVAPAAPTHVLVIPKGEYGDYIDFISKASPQDVLHYFTTIKEIARILGFSGNEGFRICSNIGAKAGQTVFHFHTHILGGAQFGEVV